MEARERVQQDRVGLAQFVSVTKETINNDTDIDKFRGITKKNQRT